MTQWKIYITTPAGRLYLFRHLTYEQALEICRRNGWEWEKPFDMNIDEE